MCEIGTDELRDLVEQAREDESFPGFFLACELGLSDPAYCWVDADGYPRSRVDLAVEYEAELDYMGAAAGLGGGDLLGGASRKIDPDGFDAGVSIYIARLESQGVLIPVRYGGVA
mgnify:CR=1 FL=1|jgi:hypothetical protein